MQSNPARWKSKPGNFDTVHAGIVFPSNNCYGIPELRPTSVKFAPRWLASYSTRIRSAQPLTDGGIHFFLDDYRFERVWTHPSRSAASLHGYRSVLTPDFSVYIGMPRVTQLYNVYRNRWCGALWQQAGIAVIPTISWAEPETYDFCFLGVPKHNPVAVSTVGSMADETARLHLIRGFKAMLRALEPSLVLCHGSLPPELEGTARILVYPYDWKNIYLARKEGYETHERQPA